MCIRDRAVVARTPTLQGTLTATFVVSTEAVTSASFSGAVRNGELERCFEKVLLRMRFPPGGAATLTKKFVLSTAP